MNAARGAHLASFPVWFVFTHGTALLLFVFRDGRYRRASFIFWPFMMRYRVAQRFSLYAFVCATVFVLLHACDAQAGVKYVFNVANSCWPQTETGINACAAGGKVWDTATTRCYTDATKSSAYTLQSCAGPATCTGSQVFDSASGQCATPCSVSGQVHDATTAACTCPAGQIVDTGPYNLWLTGQYSPSCKTAANTCAAWKGKSFYTDWPNTSSQGCATTCAIHGGSSNSPGWGYVCFFNGSPSTTSPTSATPTVAATPGATPVAGNPNDGQPLPSGVTPATNGGCGSGSFGYLNGQAVCVASSGSGATSGTASTSPTVPSNTTITNTTTTNTTNPDGSTTTTTVTQVIGGSPSGGSGNGTGTGSGNGSGSGSGGGQCDPTASDYLTCLAGNQSAYGDFGEGDKTFQSVGDNFYQGLQQTGIGQMASSIAGGLSAGTCPTVTFEMFNRTYMMAMWCTLFDDNSAVILAVAHACWILMGIVIILGA